MGETKITRRGAIKHALGSLKGPFLTHIILWEVKLRFIEGDFLGAIFSCGSWQKGFNHYTVYLRRRALRVFDAGSWAEL